MSTDIKGVSYRMTGYKPEKDYMFRVRAVNKYGISDPSMTSTLFSAPRKIYDTTMPEQNGRDIADNIFTCIFLKKKRFLIVISLKFIPEAVPIKNKSVLFQIMAWYRTRAKPLSGPILTKVYDVMGRHMAWKNFDLNFISPYIYIRLMNVKYAIAHVIVTMGPGWFPMSSQNFVNISWGNAMALPSQQPDCLFTNTFWGHSASELPMDSPHKWSVMRPVFPCDDVITICFPLSGRQASGCQEEGRRGRQTQGQAKDNLGQTGYTGRHGFVLDLTMEVLVMS